MSNSALPTFDVTLVPMPDGEGARIIQMLSEDLLSIHIDDLRYTMKHGKHPTEANQHETGTESGRRTIAYMWFEPQVRTEPLSLGFNYYLHNRTLAVRMTPDDFDRTQRDQEALYQQCVAIMEVLRDGPIKPKRTEHDWISLRNFKFLRSKSQEEADTWGELVRKWKGEG